MDKRSDKSIILETTMAQLAGTIGKGLATRLASKRIIGTDAPCIVGMQKMMAQIENKEDTISLAQGIVYWKPPNDALKRASDAVYKSETSMYGPDGGIAELREKLKEKVKIENLLVNSDIMVTTGANQAFTNIVLTLCDVDDHVVTVSSVVEQAPLLGRKMLLLRG